MLAGQAPLHGRKIREAIESVFRRTHGREMTPEERRLFGLSSGDDEHNEFVNGSSRGEHSRADVEKRRSGR